MASSGVLVQQVQESSSLLVEWVPSGVSSETGAASSVPDHPNVWTDGSLVLDQVTGVSSSGAEVFCSPV